jgi:glyoxylase-like metal-dependent hydrolase (beta-lactamase superfamily II)
MVFMILETQAVGPFFKNGFVVGCETTHEAVLIDPGDEVKSLLTFAERSALTIRHILLTHAHVDHVTGVAAAKRALGVPVHLHRDDLFLYELAVQSGAQFGLDVEPQPPIDLFFEAGEVIAFGGYEARPYHTPGHCPGGVCLQIGRKGETGRDLFVGDTLFAGSIGRTDPARRRPCDPHHVDQDGAVCVSATTRSSIRGMARRRRSVRSAGRIRFSPNRRAR